YTFLSIHHGPDGGFSDIRGKAPGPLGINFQNAAQLKSIQQCPPRSGGESVPLQINFAEIAVYMREKMLRLWLGTVLTRWLSEASASSALAGGQSNRVHRIRKEMCKSTDLDKLQSATS